MSTLAIIGIIFLIIAVCAVIFFTTMFNKWSDWSDWTSCAGPCGGNKGSKTRTRTCKFLCSGNSSENQECLTPNCNYTVIKNHVGANKIGLGYIVPQLMGAIDNSSVHTIDEIKTLCDKTTGCLGFITKKPAGNESNNKYHAYLIGSAYQYIVANPSKTEELDLYVLRSRPDFKNPNDGVVNTVELSTNEFISPLQ